MTDVLMRVVIVVDTLSFAVCLPWGWWHLLWLIRQPCSLPSCILDLRHHSWTISKLTLKYLRPRGQQLLASMLPETPLWELLHHVLVNSEFHCGRYYSFLFSHFHALTSFVLIPEAYSSVSLAERRGTRTFSKQTGLKFAVCYFTLGNFPTSEPFWFLPASLYSLFLLF